MKKTLIFILLTLVCFALQACNQEDNKGEGAEENYTLRFGYAGPETDPSGLYAEKIATDINAETNGAIEIQVFPGSQLGGEVEMVEQVRAGTIDMAFVTTGAVSNFVDELAVFDMPFLFEDLEHESKVLNGEIGDELKLKTEEAGLKTLSFVNFGIGNLVNTKVDIHSVDDAKGLKMRSLENEIFIDSFKAIGASPTPIPYPEVYTSLQQGVVDGTDALNVLMTGGKLYEVTKHLSKVGFNHRVGTVVMNEEFFNNLSNELQEALLAVTTEATVYYDETIYPEYEAGAETLMKENGVNIIEKEEIDIESFKVAVQPMYEKYESRFGEIITRINEAK